MKITKFFIISLLLFFIQQSSVFASCTHNAAEWTACNEGSPKTLDGNSQCNFDRQWKLVDCTTDETLKQNLLCCGQQASYSVPPGHRSRFVFDDFSCNYCGEGGNGLQAPYLPKPSTEEHYIIAGDSNRNNIIEIGSLAEMSITIKNIAVTAFEVSMTISSDALSNEDGSLPFSKTFSIGEISGGSITQTPAFKFIAGPSYETTNRRQATFRVVYSYRGSDYQWRNHVEYYIIPVEPASSSCVESQCSQKDNYSDWEFYCKGSDLWKHRRFYDYCCNPDACNLCNSPYTDEQLFDDNSPTCVISNSYFAIYGYVKDPNGNPVNDAIVQLDDRCDSNVMDAITSTDSNGYYSLYFDQGTVIKKILVTKEGYQKINNCVQGLTESNPRYDITLYPTSSEICNNGMDDDLDNKIDCNDKDSCLFFPTCADLGSYSPLTFFNDLDGDKKPDYGNGVDNGEVSDTFSISEEKISAYFEASVVTQSRFSMKVYKPDKSFYKEFSFTDMGTEFMLTTASVLGKTVDENTDGRWVRKFYAEIPIKGTELVSNPGFWSVEFYTQNPLYGNFMIERRDLNIQNPYLRVEANNINVAGEKICSNFKDSSYIDAYRAYPNAQNEITLGYSATYEYNLIKVLTGLQSWPPRQIYAYVYLFNVTPVDIFYSGEYESVNKGNTIELESADSSEFGESPGVTVYIYKIPINQTFDDISGYFFSTFNYWRPFRVNLKLQIINPANGKVGLITSSLSDTEFRDIIASKPLQLGSFAKTGIELLLGQSVRLESGISFIATGLNLALDRYDTRFQTKYAILASQYNTNPLLCSSGGSPLDFSLVNREGNIVGNDETGNFANDIDGVNYFKANGHTFVLINNQDSIYQLKADANGNGFGNFLVSSSKDGKVKTQYYLEQPIVDSGQTSTELVFSDKLFFDPDGDDNFDVLSNESLAVGEVDCNNGLDDDQNGKIDCNDENCQCNMKPIAQLFAPKKVVRGELFNATAEFSFDTDGQISRYVWNNGFSGNKATLSLQNPEVVSVTVFDNNGMNDTASNFVDVKPTFIIGEKTGLSRKSIEEYPLAHPMNRLYVSPGEADSVIFNIKKGDDGLTYRINFDILDNEDNKVLAFANCIKIYESSNYVTIDAFTNTGQETLKGYCSFTSPTIPGNKFVRIYVLDQQGNIVDKEIVDLIVRDDTDSDGMFDNYENLYGLSNSTQDGNHDKDNDGLKNSDEYRYLTNPTSQDTDGDNVSDLIEINNLHDPLDQRDVGSIQDRNPPVITIEQPISQKYSYTQNITIKFNVIDDSGVKSTIAKLKNITVLNGQKIILMNYVPGLYTLTVNATDTSNNIATKSVTFEIIDDIAPVIKFISPENKNYSYTDNITVSYSIYDRWSFAGENATLDGKPVVRGQKINLFSYSLGQHKLVATVSDKSGNIGTAEIIFYVVDSIPPISSAYISGKLDTDSYYIGNATITLDAYDEKSTIASIKYNLDNAGFVTYTVPFQITTAGNRTLNYYAVDSAGNQELSNTRIIKIKKIRSYEPTGITAGLWHLDETSGKTAYDSGPNKINGNFNGKSSSVSGYQGNARLYSGNGYVSFADTDKLRPENISVEVWVKTTSTKTMALFTTGRIQLGSGTSAKHYGIALTMSNGIPGFEVGTGSSNAVFASGKSKINDDKWHFVKAYYSKNGDTYELALLVDGVLQNVAYGNKQILYDTKYKETTIAARKYGKTVDLNYYGAIDEVKVTDVKRVE